MMIGYIFVFVLGQLQFVNSIQPYFPEQIVFSPDDGRTIYAIDEVNQKAFTSIKYGVSQASQQNSYVMKDFPYTMPDSPESLNYVQMIDDFSPEGCMYGTYWKYGGFSANSFPSHWLKGYNFEVKNYIAFQYNLIYSNDSSITEDHWCSMERCSDDMGKEYPCEEIYFQKNTEIPLRYGRVLRRGWNVVHDVITYKILSVSQTIDQYFEPIRKNWTVSCRDTSLGLLIYSQDIKIPLEKQGSVEIWLPSPPHRVNGSASVTVEWKSTGCSDCFTWTPNQMNFDIENFQTRQNLTITRVKSGLSSKLIPIFSGGGFDMVIPELYPIYIS